jgi:hypothetical protein
MMGTRTLVALLLPVEAPPAPEGASGAPEPLRAMGADVAEERGTDIAAAVGARECGKPGSGEGMRGVRRREWVRCERRARAGGLRTWSGPLLLLLLLLLTLAALRSVD